MMRSMHTLYSLIAMLTLGSLWSPAVPAQEPATPESTLPYLSDSDAAKLQGKTDAVTLWERKQTELARNAGLRALKQVEMSKSLAKQSRQQAIEAGILPQTP